MMASVVDQQSNVYKHFCKICNKRFVCGCAFGGHMCIHGIGDDSFHLEDENDDDDDDPVSADWDGAKATLWTRLKSCRSCKNCGKEFVSRKSFLEHGKCSTLDELDDPLASSLGRSEEDEHYVDEDDREDGRQGCRWSKWKRSMRVKVDNFGSICPSSEEEDLGNCLIMLSSGMVDNPIMTEPEELCASASRDDHHSRPSPVSFLPRLTYMSTTTIDKIKAIGNNNNNNNKGVFECKACKKVFNSHQALGGHRASHKKMKGCFAARIDRDYDYAPENDALVSGEFFLKKSMSTLHFHHCPSPSSSKKKLKVHECSICHRVFSSGQALGGHKRCHWITSDGSATNVPSLEKLARLKGHPEQIQQQKPAGFINVDHDPLTLELDLNLPALPMTDPPKFNNVVSTEMYLRPWLGFDDKEIQECNKRTDNGVKRTNEIDVANDCGPPADNNKNINSSSNNLVNVTDDEADSKVKLAKVRELNEMKIIGNSSSWLQVGIGSTAAEDEAANIN